MTHEGSLAADPIALQRAMSVAEKAPTHLQMRKESLFVSEVGSAEAVVGHGKGHACLTHRGSPFHY